MKNAELKPFVFDDHLVRVIEDENGNPWFVAKDLCNILEIQNNRDALSALDDDEKITVGISDANPRAGIPHEMNLISESGLYALVFRSRKPEARAFSKWVRSEVLAQIRKTGRYDMPERRQCSRACELPPELFEISSSLKPAMRQRLWRDALDTARLDGAGFQAACECFRSLCRLMSIPAPEPARQPNEQVRQFYHQCCKPDPGSRVSASRLYEAYRFWQKGQLYGDFLSKKRFGANMKILARSCRSDGTWYLDIALR